MKKESNQESGHKMTCRYDGTNWLDVLYTSVRNTPGGVSAAATFLTKRRGRSIGVESLRLRLRGHGENRLPMEMFELLIEWMEDAGMPFARDALYALNEQFRLRATPMSESDGGRSASALAMQVVELAKQTGVVAQVVQQAIEDGHIDDQEAADIAAAVRGSQGVLDALASTVRTPAARA